MLRVDFIIINRLTRQQNDNTYIIGHYNPSGLFSQFFTPLMLCVLILYISGGTYGLKSTPNDGFFGELFMAIFIYSQRFCLKSADEIAEELSFVFCFDVWNGARTLAFRLISQHTTFQNNISVQSLLELSSLI